MRYSTFDSKLSALTPLSTPGPTPYFFLSLILILFPGILLVISIYNSASLHQGDADFNVRVM
jgi:hypothetical protein